MIHKPKCENNDIITIRSSSDSHIHWKDHFHKNPFRYWIIADFEDDNEPEDSKAVCIRTTNNYKQKILFVMVII